MPSGGCCILSAYLVALAAYVGANDGGLLRSLRHVSSGFDKMETMCTYVSVPCAPTTAIVFDAVGRQYCQSTFSTLFVRRRTAYRKMLL